MSGHLNLATAHPSFAGLFQMQTIRCPLKLVDPAHKGHGEDGGPIDCPRALRRFGDHDELWGAEDVPLLLITHDYRIDSETLAQRSAFSAENGLKMSMTGRSFYHENAIQVDLWNPSRDPKKASEMLALRGETVIGRLGKEGDIQGHVVGKMTSLDLVSSEGHINILWSSTATGSRAIRLAFSAIEEMTAGSVARMFAEYSPVEQLALQEKLPEVVAEKLLEAPREIAPDRHDLLSQLGL